MAEKTKREGQQLLLRFPDGSDLRERLDELAKENSRSLTAEIIHRLVTSIETDADTRSAVAAQALLRMSGHGDPLKELEKRVMALETAVRKLTKQ